jgi:hypothetical protein
MAQRIWAVWRRKFSLKGNLKLTPARKSPRTGEKTQRCRVRADILKKQSAFFPRAVDDI